MKPEFTPDTVRDVLSDFRRRVQAIKAVGGIPVEAVEDGVAEVPEGWVEDIASSYYIPPDFDPDQYLTVQ